jgi:hypothetical protein
MDFDQTTITRYENILVRAIDAERFRLSIEYVLLLEEGESSW